MPIRKPSACLCRVGVEASGCKLPSHGCLCECGVKTGNPWESVFTKQLSHHFHMILNIKASIKDFGLITDKK